MLLSDVAFSKVAVPDTPPLASIFFQSGSETNIITKMMARIAATGMTYLMEMPRQAGHDKAGRWCCVAC